MVSGGSHLDSTPCWPKANTPRVQESHCCMILRYEFWEACFLEGWLCAKPSAGVSHTPSSSCPSSPSALIQPGSSVVTEVVTPVIRMVSSMQRLNVSLQRWGRMCLWEIFTFLATSKFGLPGSLLEVTRNSLTICWNNFPALALPEDFWMKCIFTGVTADTGLAFSDTENRHKKRK